MKLVNEVRNSRMNLK